MSPVHSTPLSPTVPGDDDLPRPAPKRRWVLLVVALLALVVPVAVYVVTRIGPRHAALTRIVELRGTAQFHPQDRKTFPSHLLQFCRDCERQAQNLFGRRWQLSKGAMTRWFAAFFSVYEIDLTSVEPAENISAILAPFPELQSLSVNTNDEHLDTIGKLERLESLDIHFGSISDAGLQKLAPLRHLKTFRYRCLETGPDGFGITGTGFKEWQCQSTLEYLEIASFDWTDDGMRAIGKFRNLKLLHGYFPEVDEGWLVLEDMPHVRLDPTQSLTERAVERLSAKTLRKKFDFPPRVRPISKLPANWTPPPRPKCN